MQQRSCLRFIVSLVAISLFNVTSVSQLWRWKDIIYPHYLFLVYYTVCGFTALWCQTSFISNLLSVNSNGRINERWMICLRHCQYLPPKILSWWRICQNDKMSGASLCLIGHFLRGRDGVYGYGFWWLHIWGAVILFIFVPSVIEYSRNC